MTANKQRVAAIALTAMGAFLLPSGTAEATQCFDFVTGGGWFEPPFKDSSNPTTRANFGFNAGSRNGTAEDVKGHFNLVDHERPNIHVQGTGVDHYFVVDANCRFFAGPAEFNKVPGFRYDVFTCDYGEPGRNDRISVRVYVNPDQPVYFASNHDGTPAPHGGELDGGNIQIHKPCPPPPQ